MKLLIVTPEKQSKFSGNQVTAERYKRLLEESGHEVHVDTQLPHDAADRSFDVLFALHAQKSANAINDFRMTFPDRPLVLVLTGTDLHRDLASSQLARDSLELADRIILLEPNSLQLLEPRHQEKATAILQSAEPVEFPPSPKQDRFEVVVVGHLRPVKDPFRTAIAVQLLPHESEVQVDHIGEALSREMAEAAEEYTRSTDKYSWIGRLSHEETKLRIARSKLMVLTSKLEGGPNVFAEAIVNDTPILTSRISASVGMLGENYPGFFQVGDTGQLAELLGRAENDENYYRSLVEACKKLKSLYSRENELASLSQLLNGL